MKITVKQLRQIIKEQVEESKKDDIIAAEAEYDAIRAQIKDLEAQAEKAWQKFRMVKATKGQRQKWADDEAEKLRWQKANHAQWEADRLKPLDDTPYTGNERWGDRPVGG